MENINMEKSEETMIECSFTEAEIKILSDAVLMQINDLGRAMQLTFDYECLQTLKQASGRYAALNSKLCETLK